MTPYEKAVVRMSNAVAKIKHDKMIKKLYAEMVEKKSQVAS